ncbi:MAG: choline-sulfatase [Arenicellales bacterium]|nr:choline-sulfatase [Arenicellales bacterium]
MSNRKPNILFIMADQLAPEFLSAYGNQVVKTPHLDKLSENAALFKAAYTNFPLCAPARYSMMTGCLPSNIEAWDNAAELSSEIPTFAHYLSSLGYQTCLSGKMHFCGPDQLHGFDERLTTDVYPADFTWTPKWDEPDKVLEWFHSADVVVEAGTCLRSNNLDYDDEVTFQAKRYIYDKARDQTTRPFCLVVSYIHPHDPYITRPQYWDLYDDSDVNLPEVGYDDVPKDPHSERLRKQIGIEQAQLSEQQIRDARHAYYGSISYVDEKIGELLDSLNESGFGQDTVIVFTSDHGDMLGERGLWFKMSWFEHAARIPLIVSFPPAIKAQVSEGVVSLVDLLPTLVELATDGKGIDYQTVMDGRSLLPQLSGAEGHDEVFGQYFAEFTTEPIFMVRKGPHKLIMSDADPTLCFDLREDPKEMHNLAEDPAHEQIIGALTDKVRSRWDTPSLKRWIIESQRRRHTIIPLLVKQNVSWDYQPKVRADQVYIRNNLELYEIERRSRFPSMK